MPLYILQLLVLIVHLLLLSLYSLALHLLVRRVLADERETAVHLGQVLGTEDKHQLVLHRMMPAHISHRTDILVLSILQLLLKGLQLRLQDTDVSINMMNIFLDTFNLLLTLVYFAIQRHQVFQALLHVSLVLAQSLLLLPDSSLDIGTLPLQSSDRSIAIGSSTAFCLGRCLGTASRWFSLSLMLTIGNSGFLHRLFMHRFLRIGSKREHDCQ